MIARVFPALQLEVTAAGHGEPLRFELFKGDDVEAAVTQFVQRYGEDAAFVSSTLAFSRTVTLLPSRVRMPSPIPINNSPTQSL